MERIVKINILDEIDTIHVPFDDKNNGNYKFEIINTDKNEDTIVLKLDKKACLSFSKIFAQLSFGKYTNGFHVHLGLSDENTMDSSLRIELDEPNIEVIVKTGKAIYYEVKDYKVRIKEMNVRYGTADYEDPHEIQNDLISKSYYYEFESLLQKDIYNTKGYLGDNLEDAIKNVEKLLNNQIKWDREIIP